MPIDASSPFLRDILAALGLPETTSERLTVIGDGELSSAFPVTAFATAAIAGAGLAASAMLGRIGPAPDVTVDRRLASLWFSTTIEPQGWKVPPPWDAIAGDYRAADRWIRLHTNADRHRAAALRVLGCAPERAAAAAAVAKWEADVLEAAVVAEGGAAAAMRPQHGWATHPQGRSVAAEPLVASTAEAFTHSDWSPTPDRPLHGLRVLDLTRVLAGPVATRFLAGLGAEVLRLDPPDWEEPAVIPEVTLGKRCARIDLRAPAGRARFAELLAGADILVHGYRPGALDALGFGSGERRTIQPGLIDVTLDAYGWTGPWAGRRGFDSLVQMSSGIADTGMRWRGAEKPVPLPVQALDHATGDLIAAAVLTGVRARLDGKRFSARLSLARTAALLAAHATPPPDDPLLPPVAADYPDEPEQTSWGPAYRLHPPVTIAGAPLRWPHGASALGSATPEWVA